MKLTNTPIYRLLLLSIDGYCACPSSSMQVNIGVNGIVNGSRKDEAGFLKQKEEMMSTNKEYKRQDFDPRYFLICHMLLLLLLVIINRGIMTTAFLRPRPDAGNLHCLRNGGFCAGKNEGPNRRVHTIHRSTKVYRQQVPTMTFHSLSLVFGLLLLLFHCEWVLNVLCLFSHGANGSSPLRSRLYYFYFLYVNNRRDICLFAKANHFSVSAPERSITHP